MSQLIPSERIEKCIYLIRGQKVMLSIHIAELYGVETRALNQAVKRNQERFPADFMFQLGSAEAEWLVSQNVIPHKKYLGGALPFAFTEQGVAMLSSVLRSERAVQVNIAIMRAFVKLREMLASNRELARRMDKMEEKYDAQFKVVFDVLHQLTAPPPASRRKIGFQREASK